MAVVAVVAVTAVAGPDRAGGSPAGATSGGNGPLYGVTVDRVARLAPVVGAIEKLPHPPTVRVVFTWNGSTPVPPWRYRVAVQRLDHHARVMGELLDSSFEKRVPLARFAADVKDFVSTLGKAVSIWEIGNEVNGNWTGPYPAVEAKLVAAFDEVHVAGGTSALTLFANEYAPHHCGDGAAELTPVEFSERYVPAAVRDGISYVLESFYPTACRGLTTLPTVSAVAAEMRRLHRLYPNARVGFGELGLPAAVTPQTAARAKQVMAWGYALDPRLSYYVGGYFWWYAYEDCFTGKRLLAASLADAFRAERKALG